MLQELEYNFDNEDAAREENFRINQAALQHAVNEKGFEEEFIKCVGLLEAIETRPYYKKGVLASNNHPKAATNEQHRYILSLCKHFGLKSPIVTMDCTLNSVLDVISDRASKLESVRVELQKMQEKYTHLQEVTENTHTMEHVRLKESIQPSWTR